MHPPTLLSLAVVLISALTASAAILSARAAVAEAQYYNELLARSAEGSLSNNDLLDLYVRDAEADAEAEAGAGAGARAEAEAEYDDVPELLLARGLMLGNARPWKNGLPSPPWKQGHGGLFRVKKHPHASKGLRPFPEEY